MNWKLIGTRVGIFDSSMDIFRVYIFNDIRKYIKKMKKSENNVVFIKNYS